MLQALYPPHDDMCYKDNGSTKDSIVGIKVVKDISKELTKDFKESIKETTLAAYSALNAEIVQRLGSQSTVL